MVDNTPKSLLGLKPTTTITFEVIETSDKTGFKKGDKINVKGTDLSSSQNGFGVIGRAKKDSPPPALDYGKDPSISRETGELHYKFNQFGMKSMSKGSGVFFNILHDQKYQILPDMFYKAEGLDQLIHIGMVFPNQPVQGKDQLLFSTQLTEGDEQTIPLSSFQGQIKDMTKAQMKIILYDQKTKSAGTETLLITDSVNTSKEFTIGSDKSCDVVLPSGKPKAGVIAYNSEHKCWYIQGDKSSKIFQSQCTMYQNTQGRPSFLYRLANGMQVAAGADQATIVKVSVQ